MQKETKRGLSAVIVICFLSLVFTHQNEAMAQTNNSGNATLSPSSLVSIIGPTTIISVIGTGLFSRYNTKKQLNEQQTNILRQVTEEHGNAIKQLRIQLEYNIEQLKNERQATVIKDKVALYAFFIFILGRMLNNPAFLRRESPEAEWKLQTSINEIDAALKEKFYLLDPKIVLEWMPLRGKWFELYEESYDPNLFKTRRQELVDGVYKIRNLLIDKYNEEIRSEYQAIMNVSLNQIEKDEKTYQVIVG